MKWSELMVGDVLERTHVWLVLRVDWLNDRLVKLTFCILDDNARIKNATFSVDQEFSVDYILRLVDRR